MNDGAVGLLEAVFQSNYVECFPLLQTVEVPNQTKGFDLHLLVSRRFVDVDKNRFFGDVNEIECLSFLASRSNSP